MLIGVSTGYDIQIDIYAGEFKNGEIRSVTTVANRERLILTGWILERVHLLHSNETTSSKRCWLSGFIYQILRAYILYSVICFE